MNTLREAIDNFYDNKNSKCSARTKTHHFEVLRNLFNILEVKEDDLLNIKNVENVENVMMILNAKYSNKITTIYNFIKSISIFIQIVDEKNITLLKKYRSLMVDYANKNSKIQKIKIENKILPITRNEIEEIDNIYKNKVNVMFKNGYLKARDHKLLVKYLIVILYSGLYGIAPVRNDYPEAKLTYNYENEKNKEKYNFYDMKNDIFIFNVFKTFEKKGQTINNKIPNETKTLLRKLLPLVVGENNFIFVNKNNKPYRNDTFGKLIKRTFRGRGVNVLRKSFITNRFNDLKKMLDDLNETSELMMHSPSAVKEFYLHAINPVNN